MTKDDIIYENTNGTVEYIGRLAFMYSCVPILVRLPKLSGRVSLIVENEEGLRFEEARSLYDGTASFDISKIMLHLAPDVSGLLNEQRAGVGAYSVFSVSLSYFGTELWSTVMVGIYGALNANESYRFNPQGKAAPASRRLWVNFPQTLNLQRDNSDTFRFYTEDEASIYPGRLDTDNFSYEVDLMHTLSLVSNNSADALLRSLKGGAAQTVGLSNFLCVKAQAEEATDTIYWLRIQPDLTPRDAQGVTFLRWLQRDGSIGYWLCKNGELQTSSEVSSSFRRFYDNPNAPSYWDNFLNFDRNPQQTDYSEARTLSLSAEIYSYEDYEYLCGLFTSPVVDRFVIKEGQEAWERVNILPSSQGVSIRRGTPYVKQLEIAIQLPKRDTIKL